MQDWTNPCCLRAPHAHELRQHLHAHPCLVQVSWLVWRTESKVMLWKHTTNCLLAFQELTWLPLHTDWSIWKFLLFNTKLNQWAREKKASQINHVHIYFIAICLVPPKVSLKNSKIYTKFYCNHTRDTSRVKYNKYYDAILHLLNYSSKHKFTHSKYTNTSNEVTLVSHWHLIYLGERQ